MVDGFATPRWITPGRLLWGGTTIAFLGYDAYLWFVEPGWRQATLYTINGGGPAFLPVILPLLGWIIYEFRAWGGSSNGAEQSPNQNDG